MCRSTTAKREQEKTQHVMNDEHDSDAEKNAVDYQILGRLARGE